jgi:hypothetical protein
MLASLNASLDMVPKLHANRYFQIINARTEMGQVGVCSSAVQNDQEFVECLSLLNKMVSRLPNAATTLRSNRWSRRALNAIDHHRVASIDAGVATFAW